MHAGTYFDYSSQLQLLELEITTKLITLNIGKDNSDVRLISSQKGNQHSLSLNYVSRDPALMSLSSV